MFKLDTTGKYAVLYSFAEYAGGANPDAGVIRDSAGNLYGTTYRGGAAGKGTVFKLDTTGKETVLHSFTGADGGHPYAGVKRPLASMRPPLIRGGNQSDLPPPAQELPCFNEAADRHPIAEPSDSPEFF